MEFYCINELFLNSSLLPVNGAENGGIELGLAVVGIQTVDLLLDIGQLRIAESTDGRIIQKGMGQTLIALDELFLALGCLAIAPTGVLSRRPADTTVLRDKVGLILALGTGLILGEGHIGQFTGGIGFKRSKFFVKICRLIAE